MTTETPTDQSALRPVSGNPDVHHSYGDDDWDLETPIDPRVGWSLSYGCKVTVGFDGDVLHVTVSACDRDQRDGITKRAVTREQVADYARKLLTLVGVDAGSDPGEPLVPMSEHVDVVMAQGFELVGEQFEAETARGELEKSRAEVERLTAENAELRRELAVVEAERDDLDLELNRAARGLAEAAKASA